jgi:transcriptional regulator GlxA family with amidase domain
VQRWIAANPGGDLRVEKLAERAGMSARHFSRLFRLEVGMTPARWVDASRISAARAMLEDGDLAPKQVAGLCGFASADTLRRTFARHLGISPAQYRRAHQRAE